MHRTTLKQLAWAVQRPEQHHRHATRRSCTLNADLDQATYNAVMADPTYNVTAQLMGTF
jgi:hypothetical protein